MYPSGLNYGDVKDLIEVIAENKAKQYGKISYLNRQDLKQEVRIKCWSVLSSYDSKRAGANLKTFLSVCSDNKIKDLKRSLLYKHNNNPCNRCDFHHIQGKRSRCVKYKAKKHCEMHNRHELFVQAKMSNSFPVSIDEYKIYDEKADSHIKYIEFLDFVYGHLPSSFYPLFDKLKNSGFEFSVLKPREKKILRYMIGNIYIKHGGL